MPIIDNRTVYFALKRPNVANRLQDDVLRLDDALVAIDTKLKAIDTAYAVASTEAGPGIIELATQAETNTGADDARAITPLKLAGMTALTTRAGVIAIATQAEATAGTDNTKAVTAQVLVKTATDIAVAIALALG